MFKIICLKVYIGLQSVTQNGINGLQSVTQKGLRTEVRYSK